MPKKSKDQLYEKLGIYGATPITLLADERLTDAAIRVWIAIQSWQGTDPESYPGVKKIAERAHVSVSTVTKSTNLLCDTGWLRKKQRGLRKSNVYETLAFREAAPQFKVHRARRSQSRNRDGRFHKSAAAEPRNAVAVECKNSVATEIPIDKTTCITPPDKNPPPKPPQGGELTGASVTALRVPFAADSETEAERHQRLALRRLKLEAQAAEIRGK